MFYGLTPCELRRLAYNFAEAKSMTHNFNKSSKQARKDWLALFLKRNPRISLRKPKGTSINRISSFHHGAVRRYFDNLELVMGKHKFFRVKSLMQMKREYLLFRNLLKFYDRKIKNRLVQRFLGSEEGI
jgi:hypothetical protein